MSESRPELARGSVSTWTPPTTLLMHEDKAVQLVGSRNKGSHLETAVFAKRGQLSYSMLTWDDLGADKKKRV